MKTTLACVLLLLALPCAADDARVIRNEGDLPQKRFKTELPPSKLFLDAKFDAFARDARAEGERLLAEYTIEDAVIERRIRGGLAALDILAGDSARAARRAEEQRARETKPQLKSIGFLLYDAIAAASEKGGCSAGAARIDAMLRDTDPALVRDEVLLRLGQIETMSGPYLAGLFVTALDPTAEQAGSIDVLDAMWLATARVQARELPRCRSEFALALRAWAGDPAHAPRDIWPERDPSADAMRGAKPVVVGVWDTGMDTGLFPNQLAIDPAEPLDGKDNDGNGVVDDVHGPSWDAHVNPLASTLRPASATVAAHLALYTAGVKGERDLIYGFDTDEARLYAQRARDADTDAQTADADAQAEIGFRSHGTFVSSQIADGAPWVRLYNIALIPGGNDPKPVPYAEPEFERLGAAITRAARRMRGAGVRIVNMSWGYTVDEFAHDLVQNRLETDPERARARAEKMYQMLSAPLEAAMRACPDILFVASAGNNNQTAQTFAAAPQGFKLPNLLVVGATGQSGQPTSFTTFGGNVGVYARGEGAAGRIPGGMPMRSSGTSMAAPLTVRAAAEMLAVNPKLTPAMVIEGLKSTATDGPGGTRLIHPAHAVEWARTKS